MKIEKYSKQILRISMSLLFLYFGIAQITNPVEWSGFVPSYALITGMEATTIVIINSIIEIILGGLMLIGLFTRIASLILSLHLLIITLSLGINPLGIRDLGLTIATFTIFLNGTDDWCVDKRIKNN